jgi:hypothetical protein
MVTIHAFERALGLPLVSVGTLFMTLLHCVGSRAVDDFAIRGEAVPFPVVSASPQHTTILEELQAALCCRLFELVPCFALCMACLLKNGASAFHD